MIRGKKNPVRDFLCVAQGFSPGYQCITHKTFPLGKAYVMPQTCSEIHRLLLTEKMSPNQLLPRAKALRYTQKIPNGIILIVLLFGGGGKNTIHKIPSSSEAVRGRRHLPLSYRPKTIPDIVERCALSGIFIDWKVRFVRKISKIICVFK